MAGHSPSKDGRSSERPKSRPSTSSNGAAVLYTAHFWLGCVKPHHVDARRDRTVSAGPPQRCSCTRGARRSQAEAHPRRRPERAYWGGMNCIRSPKARQSKTSSISAARYGLCPRQFRDDAMVLRRGRSSACRCCSPGLDVSISATVAPVLWRYENSPVLLARDQNRGNAPPARSSPSW
jgi:hypothetical protein